LVRRRGAWVMFPSFSTDSQATRMAAPRAPVARGEPLAMGKKRVESTMGGVRRPRRTHRGSRPWFGSCTIKTR